MKKNCKTKNKINFKIKNYFLIFVILQITISPLISFAAPAAAPVNDFKNFEKTIGDVPCDLKVSCWVVSVMAWIGYRILQIVNVFFYVSVQIFNLSANLSLNYAAYSKNTAVAVYNGWKLARDFMNLFFIFVILFIAISIILQLHTYGSQKVLFRLIGVAIFINFSFFVTQQVIVASNSMALFFAKSNDVSVFSSPIVTALNPQNTLKGYHITVKSIAESTKKMDVEQRKKVCEDVYTDAKITSIDIKNCDPLVPNCGFGKAEKDRCLAGAENKLDAKNTEAMLKDLEDSLNPETALLPVIITTIGGIAVILTACFIFLAGAIMFVLRTVVLWILLILSPIAFMSFALPSGESFMRKWWSRLFKEAFFAPAMMFMLFIVFKIITYKDPATNLTFLERFVLQNNQTGIGESFVFNFYLVLQYIFLLILLGSSLVVARSLGAKGSSVAVSWGSKAAYFAGGAAAGALITRPARRYAAGAAEKIATAKPEGRVGKALSGLAGLTGITAASRLIAGGEKKRIEDVEKQWSKYSPKETAASIGSGKFLTREGLVGRVGALAKENKLDLLKPEQLRQAHKYMSQLGMDTSKIETYMPSLAKDDAAREKAIQSQSPDKVGGILKNTEEFAQKRDAAGNVVGPNDNQKHLEKYWGEGHLEEADKAAQTDKTGKTKESLKEFFDAMAREYKTTNSDDVIKGLESEGKKALADAIRNKSKGLGGTKDMDKIIPELNTTLTPQGKMDLKAANQKYNPSKMDDITSGLEARGNFKLAKALKTEEGETIFKKNATGGKDFETGSQLTAQKAKQTLQLNDAGVANIIKAAIPAPGKTVSEEDKKKTVDTLNAADTKRMVALLEELSATERRELRQMLKSRDAKLEQKVGTAERERTEQTLKLEDQEIADRMKKVTATSSEEERKEVANIGITANDKKLLEILEKLSPSERKELKNVADTTDVKLAERLVKSYPELATQKTITMPNGTTKPESPEAERQKVFGSMKKEDIQNFDYAGLKTRTTPIDLAKIIDDMIKSFNIGHLKALYEKEGQMREDFVNRLKVNVEKDLGKTPSLGEAPGSTVNANEIADYMAKKLKRPEMANSIRTGPSVREILGLP